MEVIGCQVDGASGHSLGASGHGTERAGVGTRGRGVGCVRSAWRVRSSLDRWREQVDCWDQAIDFEHGGHADGWERPDTRAGAFSQRVRSSRARLCVEPNGSISWGLLFMPHGRLFESSSLVLAN